MSDAILAPQTREYFQALAQLVQPRVDEYCCYMSSQQFNRATKSSLVKRPGEVPKRNAQTFKF